MSGGLWMHRHIWFGRPMAHLVSANRERLLEYGRRVGLAETRLQFKPLKDPRTGERRDAWHWDLGGAYLPPPLPQSSSDDPSAAGDRLRPANPASARSVSK
jgi:hypothetical protein